MNRLRNSRFILSRLLPCKHAAVSPPRPRLRLAQARFYYEGNTNHRHTLTSPRRERLPFLRNHAVPFVMVGGGAVAIYVNIREVVPYTNRTQFIIVPQKLELLLGQLAFNIIKEEMGPKVLPPLHPDSVRVHRIASELVRAVDRGLAEHKRHEVGAVRLDVAPSKHTSTDLAAQRDDDRGEGLGAQPQTSRSRSLLVAWEVIVVKDEVINAICAPGGKIVVFTGLLDKLDDSEAATVIGHEIAHTIARHTAEDLTKIMFRFIRHIITLQFIYGPGVKQAVSMPLFRRTKEIEADHIGLMLLAAAGYDPQVAPLVYEKLGKIIGDDDFLTVEDHHPSGLERARFLSQQDIMNDALHLYRGFHNGQVGWSQKNENEGS